MGDTVNSFLMGQAAADLLNSLKARFEDARNDAEIRSLMYQMRDAYDRQVVALKKNIDILKGDLARTIESRDFAVDGVKKLALRRDELKQKNSDLTEKNTDLESRNATLEEENKSLKLQLKKSLAEAVVYSSVAYAAKTVLEASPELRERTRQQYTNHITACIKKSLERIREQNGDEMFQFAAAYVNWASTNYLKDVGPDVQKLVFESLNKNRNNSLNHTAK